jgi:tetratricopeptide (TPR) repeat protein
MTDLYAAQRVEAAVLRGNGYAARGQWDQAVRAYQSALEEDPESVEARYRLAVCQARLGQNREARLVLQHALNSAGISALDRVRVTRLLGRICLQTGDHAGAARCFEIVLDLTGTAGGPALDQLAQVMCKSGDYRRGFSLFFRALSAAAEK